MWKFRTIRAAVLSLGLALSWCACGTVAPRYYPAQVGRIDRGEVVDGLTFTIDPSSEKIHKGEVLFFTASLKNVGTESLWIPREPDILLLWIYPNGQRDNLVLECANEKFYTFDQVVQLKPGQTYQRRLTLRTYYFPKPGITEFKALYSVARNTNPDFKSMWTGKIISNSYGVRVERKQDR